MEQYLVEDYGVIEDKRYLISEDQIEDYFRDEAYDLFDCGQGYYQDEASAICCIGDKFYEVIIKAEIESSKQDRGDRLYWVEYVESVTYKEIEKPQPKTRNMIIYQVWVTKEEKNILEGFLGENCISYQEQMA